MTPQPSGIQLLLEAWGMFLKLNEGSESRARPQGKAELLQNLVNWLLMGASGGEGSRRPLPQASVLSTGPVVSLNLQLKPIPGGSRNCPTASQSCHPKDTATSPHISIMWLLCPFYLCSQLLLWGGEECGALLRGFALLSFHLSCLLLPSADGLR